MKRAAGITIAVLVLCAGIVLWFWRDHSPTPTNMESPPPQAPITNPVATPTNNVLSRPVREYSVWETNAVAQSPRLRPDAAKRTTGVAATPAIATSTSAATDIMNRLAHIELHGNSISPAQVATINDLFRQLREQGASAIPAIRQFLDENTDIDFAQTTGGEQIDYQTLRIGLLDALSQIGGQDALDLQLRLLQSTAEPKEIAFLAAVLEQQAPAQYRQLEINAAREALAQAMTGQLAGRDVSPLFEVLQALGDPSVVADLENAARQWNYYATLALAGMADGAGVPALIRLAQDPKISSMGVGDFAYRPLAQVALLYPTAANALVEQTRQNQIPDSAWPTVSASLAGTYIQYGYQVFGSTAPPTTWTPAEVNNRMALIDRLLATTPNATARQSLQNARQSLVNRLASPPP